MLKQPLAKIFLLFLHSQLITGHFPWAPGAGELPRLDSLGVSSMGRVVMGLGCPRVGVTGTPDPS